MCVPEGASLSSPEGIKLSERDFLTRLYLLLLLLRGEGDRDIGWKCLRRRRRRCRLGGEMSLLLLLMDLGRLMLLCVCAGINGEKRRDARGLGRENLLHQITPSPLSEEELLLKKKRKRGPLGALCYFHFFFSLSFTTSS